MKIKIFSLTQKELVFLVILFTFFGHLKSQPISSIYLKDKSNNSGIDFLHFAPRPRWCEIGPTVVGTATNEELSLVLWDILFSLSVFYFSFLFPQEYFGDLKSAFTFLTLHNLFALMPFFTVFFFVVFTFYLFHFGSDQNTSF